MTSFTVDARSHISCMHVVAHRDEDSDLTSAGIPANSIVFGQLVEGMDVPYAYTSPQEGRHYLGIADKPIPYDHHGTVIVAGVVTLYGDNIPKVPYSIVFLSNVRDMSNARNCAIGTSVSCNVRGRVGADGNVEAGCRVLLCPWMAACDFVSRDASTRFIQSCLGDQYGKFKEDLGGWSDENVEKLESHFIAAHEKNNANAAALPTPCFIQ